MKKRQEAFLVKDVDPTFSLIMSIMPRRYDATNYSYIPIWCDGMDNYIAKKYEEGVKFNYMEIIIASLVRVIAMRPQLNRFTMNARLYERHKVTVSFTIKQALKDNAEELTIKQSFNGNETLMQVKEKLENVIKTNIEQSGSTNKTVSGARSVGGLPVWLSKSIVNYLRWSDKHNSMPKAFFDMSPFHSSFFITNLKSIKTDTIVHHCYDFGTTSLFIAMGKEKFEPVVDDEKNIVVKKVLQIGFSADERICDGLYFGNSLRMLKRFIKDPSQLEAEYHDAKVDQEIEKDRLLAEKLAKKTKKKARIK